MKESGAKHKGLIEIPNLSEENEVEDTEVRYLMMIFVNQVSAIDVEHLEKQFIGLCNSCAVVLVNHGGLICQGLLLCGGNMGFEAE